MARIQTIIPDEMERKLRLYSAYLGISKNDYLRQIITFYLRNAEETTIPLEIVKSAEEKGVGNADK